MRGEQDNHGKSRECAAPRTARFREVEDARGAALVE
jgi:hypothetical protein